MNISDELERILGDMDEDERKKADESNVAKQMALLAEGGTPKNPPTGDLIHELRAQMYAADPANTQTPQEPDLATQFIHWLSNVYFPGLTAQQANVPTAAQGSYADVPSHASGGSVGYHQPDALEQNMLALGGAKAMPIIMALHKAAGGNVEGAQSPKSESPSADDSGGLFDPEMFGVPTGAVAANDALEREFQAARANPMQYGTDVVNRGMIAGLAGAPVDMTNEVLKQFGLGSEKPFGGSESIGSGMESMGMVSPERHMVGELGAGLVDPFSTAATGAKLAHGMTAAMPLMTAYHGSPHVFSAFDASKIGTGEGAQAYGHGIYIAEDPNVADSYKKTLAYKAFDLAPEAEKLGIKLSAGARGEFMRQVQNDAEPKVLARRLQNANISTREIPQEKLAELFDAYKQKGGGNFYTVDLPDEMIDKMLDWDKPLSQQPPEVQKALASTKNKQLRAVIDYANSPYSMPELEGEVKTMGEAIKLLGVNVSPAKGSAMLAKEGIPGIRYLDASSRGKSQGTHNFVVFPGNEDKLKILSRNNEPVNP